MKKIGLLTFHRALNYGAVLQAYALQSAVKKVGFECEIIDFVTKSHCQEEKLAAAGEKKLPALNRKRYFKFCQFINKYLHLSSTQYHTERDFIEHFPQYDSYIVGSDQVWNPDMVTRGTSSKIYFLHLDGFHGKIAYAPSIGIAKEKRLQPYLKYIQDFDYLSMRENKSAQYLTSQLNRRVEQADDPVFLLERDKWKRLAVQKYITPPYVLLYLVREDEFSLKITKQIAKKLHCRVIVINYLKEYSGYHVYNCTTAGPIEFLNLIRNAQVVCTSSFHATAFSIIYNVPFFTFEQIKEDDRISDLLEHFKLKDRLLSKESSIPDVQTLRKKPDVSDQKYRENMQQNIRKLKYALRSTEK